MRCPHFQLLKCFLYSFNRCPNIHIKGQVIRLGNEDTLYVSTGSGLVRRRGQDPSEDAFDGFLL